MSELGEKLLRYVMAVGNDSMDIKFHQMDSNGQVSFMFPVEDIEDEPLRIAIIEKKDSLLLAVEPFYANMVGQMIIRKNITAFFEFFRDMSDEDYIEKLMNMEYVSFGMGCNGNYISMIFHGSLLYNMFIALLNNQSEETK